jgi:hypothetical protein
MDVGLGQDSKERTLRHRVSWDVVMLVAWLLIDTGKEKTLLCGVELDAEMLVAWLIMDIGIEAVLPRKPCHTEGACLAKSSLMRPFCLLTSPRMGSTDDLSGRVGGARDVTDNSPVWRGPGF